MLLHTLNIACNSILPYPCESIFSHIDLLLLTRTTACAWFDRPSTHARYIECLATANAAAIAVCGRYARTLTAPRIARHGWSSDNFER